MCEIHFEIGSFGIGVVESPKKKNINITIDKADNVISKRQHRCWCFWNLQNHHKTNRLGRKFDRFEGSAGNGVVLNTNSQKNIPKKNRFGRKCDPRKGSSSVGVVESDRG